ncbi:MAG: hypothetical protein ACOYYJ_18730 [Chloroflexota bacterium]
MAIEYPWYEIVEGDVLEQGDVLLACPIIVPIVGYPLEGNTQGDVQIYDVIIMTQSCDLENEKVQDIIVCPHWDLRTAGETDSVLAKKSTWQSIIKGHQYRYAMLSAWRNEEFSIDVRIVDFGRIFSLPRDFVRQLATERGKRLRLCPPYREHLSQSFARFFMRVGLPQDIELPE